MVDRISYVEKIIKVKDAIINVYDQELYDLFEQVMEKVEEYRDNELNKLDDKKETNVDDYILIYNL